MAQSKMFDHCLRVYEHMLSQSEVDEDGTVYRGFLSVLFAQELKLPVPYYTPVKRTLEELGCIEQQKRGGGKTRSEWRLYYPPDPNLFDHAKLFDVGRRKNSSRSSLELAVATLHTRLIEVEHQLDLLTREVHDADYRLGDSQQVS